MLGAKAQQSLSVDKAVCIYSLFLLNTRKTFTFLGLPGSRGTTGRQGRRGRCARVGARGWRSEGGSETSLSLAEI